MGMSEDLTKHVYTSGERSALGGSIRVEICTKIDAFFDGPTYLYVDGTHLYLRRATQIPTTPRTGSTSGTQSAKGQGHHLRKPNSRT